MKIILTAQEVKQILEEHVNNTLGVTASVFETEDVVLEVGKPSKSNLDLLKERADKLGIQYRNTIGEDALRKKIEESEQSTETENTEDDLIETVLPKEESTEEEYDDFNEEEEVEKPKTSLFNKEEDSEDDEEPKVKRGGIFGNRNA